MITTLKQLEPQVTNTSLKSKINTAIDTWDGVPEADLDEKEKNTISKLTEYAEEDIKKNSEEEKRRIEEEENKKVEAQKKIQQEAEAKRRADLIASTPFPHEEYIKQEEISVDRDTKEKMSGWGMLRAKLLKNPGDENLKTAVIKASESLKQLIMTKEEEKIAKAKAEAAEATKAEIAQAAKKEKEAKEAAEAATKAQEQAEKEASEKAKKDEEESNSSYFSRMRKRLA